MSIYSKSNRFVSYLLILVSLFILVLFTKDQIMNLQDNLDLKDTYNSELSEKRDKLESLNKLKDELKDSSDKASRYNTEVKEDELIDYIYSYIEKTNNKNGIIVVRSISMNSSKDTEMGFKETTVNLNLRVANEKKLKDILNFLTSKDSKYNFFIDSFTYSYGKVEDKKFNVSIPLKILHK